MIVEQAPPPYGRPEFMEVLGLLPPYAVEDVHMAYREKAKAAHPDRGGSVEEFQRLKEAFDRALEYAKFRASRRLWLAAQVERYVEQDAVVHEVRRRGGHVEIEQIDWLKRSIGDDFALVTERLRGLSLRGLADGDAFLHYLGQHRPALVYLLWLDLADGRITDDGLRGLPALDVLRGLDLSGTEVTRRGLEVLRSLPDLEWLNVADTPLRWYDRWRLRRSFPRLRVVAERLGPGEKLSSEHPVIQGRVVRDP